MLTTGGMIRTAVAAAALAAIAAAARPQSIEDGRGRIHLREIAATAVIEGRVARVTLEQIVGNSGERDAEAILLIPLPGGAAVDGLSLWIDGKETTGALLDSSRARGTYEGIVRKAKDPALLENAGGRLLRLRVFPVPPGGERRVKIAWSELLAGEAGSIHWSLPLRYPVPPGATPPRASVVVSVASGRPLAAVWSPSHATEVIRGDDHHAVVSWESGDRAPDRDFVLLLLERTRDPGLSVLTSRPAGETAGTFLLVLTPGDDPRERPLPRDLVLCADTSGSMAGEKMRQTREAMRHAVRTLGPEDRFTLVAFATTARSFRPGLQEVDRESREAALAWIDGLEASGGSALEAGLLAALEPLRGDREGRGGTVLLLTDGRPSAGETDPDGILARVVPAAAPGVRAFVLGLGGDADTGFLDSLAAALRGTRDEVSPGEDVRRRVSAILDRSRHSSLTDLSLEAEGVRIQDMIPSTLPDLFRGGELVLLGRFEGEGDAVVRIRARGRDGERVFQRRIPFPARTEGREFVDRLWAVRRVGLLREENRLHGDSAERLGEIHDLARSHGIVTPSTSWLVLEPGMEYPADASSPVGGRDGDSDGDPRFNADAPFEGTGGNASIGIGGGGGGMFGGRRGGRRNLRLEGGAGTEGAVEFALRWILGRQEKDGGFGGAGETGHALLPFLGYGETHKTPLFGREVRAALKYLKGLQDAEGCFGPRAGPSWKRDHALAALAMNETYGLTQSPLFKASARNGTDRLLALRNPDGGWSAGDGSDRSDPLTTAWAVMALRSAEWSGLEERRGDLRRSANWLAEAETEGRPAAAHAVLLARLLCMESVTDGFGLRALATSLGPPPDRADAEAWYFGTLVAYQLGGDTWKTWNEAMKRALVDSQRVESGIPEHGSWDPAVPEDGAARFETTLQMALSLEVYYRYARVFGTVNHSSPEVPGVVGEETVRASIEAGRLARKTGPESPPPPPVLEGALRKVAGRLFLREGRRWKDLGLDPGAPRTRMVPFSPEWKALFRSGTAEARWLALGRVTVEIQGMVVEVGE